MTDWLARQALGRRDVGDSDILFTAHYHHLAFQEAGARTWFQCPALEGGSDWWVNQSGQDARKGMLTMRIGRGVAPTGWADMEVL